jgi:hypothetical protein
MDLKGRKMSWLVGSYYSCIALHKPKKATHTCLGTAGLGGRYWNSGPPDTKWVWLPLNCIVEAPIFQSVNGGLAGRLVRNMYAHSTLSMGNCSTGLAGRLVRNMYAPSLSMGNCSTGLAGRLVRNMYAHSTLSMGNCSTELEAVLMRTEASKYLPLNLLLVLDYSSR